MAHVTSAIALDDRASLAAHAVDERLSEYVRTYWTLNVEEPPALVRVIPDGQVDLVFDLDSHAAHVAGTCDKSFEAVHERPTHLLGVSLLPGAAASFLDVPVAALDESWQPLESIIGPVARALID